MSLPFATTTISVLRRPPGVTDSYDAPGATTVVTSGVRAHLSSPSGTEQIVGGQTEAVMFGLACDPCDVSHTDRVLDAADGQTYEVVWVRRRRGLGLDHMTGQLRQVAGAA